MKDFQNKKITGAAIIVMSSVFISRLTGFIREMLVPNMLGVNEIGDAYNLAFKVTGLMYDLLVGGAISAALIPVLTGYMAKKEEKEGWKAVSTFINIITIIMIIVCVLGMIFAPEIVSVIAVGFNARGGDISLTIELTRILFPSVAFLMLAGFANGVLNSYHRFAASAYGPVIYNLGSVLSILLLSKISVKAVAYGVMCSSAIYFIFQLMFTLKNLKFFKFKFYFGHQGFKKLYKLAIPSLISSSIVQVNIIISSSFATLFSSGSVTALNLADRIWQMPYGIIAQGMGIAILPTLSSKYAIGEVDTYKKTLMKSLKTVLLLTIPSAIGFIVLKEPIIRTIFKFTDKFGDEAVRTSGSVLMFFSIALLTQSIVAIINRGFYAVNDTRTPLFIGSGTIFMNIILSVIFYKTTKLGISGMALAYSTASFVNAILLLVFLNKKEKGIYLGELASFFVKVIPASLIMGVVVYFLNLLCMVGSISRLMQFVYLCLEILAGVGVYLLTVILFKVEEALIIKNKLVSWFGITKIFGSTGVEY